MTSATFLPTIDVGGFPRVPNTPLSFVIRVTNYSNESKNETISESCGTEKRKRQSELLFTSDYEHTVQPIKGPWENPIIPKIENQNMSKRCELFYVMLIDFFRLSSEQSDHSSLLHYSWRVRHNTPSIFNAKQIENSMILQ